MNIETMLNRPSVRGLEFRLGIEAYAHKAASALGLPGVRVEWGGVQTAGINTHGDLYLAGVKDEAVVTRAMISKYAAYVVHELLHRKYTNFGVHAADQYARVLHNAIEDGWIENNGIKSGLLGNIGPLLGNMIDTMTTEALATVTDWNDARQYPYILAVHCRTHATIKCPTNPRLAPIFDEAARRCLLATSSQDTLDIANWVYDQLKQENEKEKDKKKSKGKDKPKDEAKNDPAKGQDGPTSPGKSEPKGEGADKADSAPDAPVNEPNVANEVEPSLEVSPESSSGGSYSTDTDVKRDGYHSGATALGVTNLPIPAKLRYEVKRLFDDSGLSEFTRNRKAGVINIHALPSVAAGNDRVFKRRLDVEGIDSAVVICLDVSGSMFADRAGGRFIRPAVQTCRALLETLSAAGVKTSIVTFGSEVSILKRFDTNHRAALPLLDHVFAGGGTNDYTALRFSHQILAQRPENRKITFVITDGRGKPWAVKEQVNSGKALGITTIGIGIRADVDDIYGQAVRVDNNASIGEASFKQIKLAA